MNQRIGHRMRLGYHTKANYFALINYLRRMTNKSGGRDSIESRPTKTCLVAGLGNFGMEKSRHSVGRVVVDSLASQLGLAWQKERRILGYVSQTSSVTHQLILLKPRLYMNESGRSIRKAAAFYEVEASDIFLVHDDLDLPLGKCSVKSGGSAKGHNGVKSAISCLQSDRMARLRFGIGRPSWQLQVSEYVLQDFSEEEVPLLKATVQSCVELLMIRFALFMPRTDKDIIAMHDSTESDKPKS
eukprot:m.26636 g.26636  ORF g.26636 m.26636 type:complete len:243 (+) comp29425_c0_seq3:507-1235(+)